MSTSSPPTASTDTRGRGCTSTPVTSHRGQQPDLGGADDRPGPHGDVAGLHVVAGAPHVGARPHAAQHPHPRLAAVGPAQRQHRVGQCRQRRPGLHPRGLARLQSAGRPCAGRDGAHHRQCHAAPGRRLLRPLVLVVGLLVGWLDLAHAEHVDAADRVAVDGGLIESGQRAFGHHFFGAQQPLRLGDGDPHRPRRHRGGRHPGLLLFHRTHSAPFFLDRARTSRRLVFGQTQSSHQPPP